MTRFSPGSLVTCREREWVVLPSDQEDVLLLRPIGGSEAEICGIFLPIEGQHIRHASFPLPDPAQAGDFVAGKLLRDASRLVLRSGAGPFRSLGRLGIRPRPYQLVPLIMALRLEVVRLLIADDVGIGKTIEAGLIIRELIDRGEIQRFTVLCPPHLCEQWQRELSEKFAIEAVVVRASTAAALERSLPRADRSLFEHFPFTIASIDYLKSERRRETFLRTCPELVIVDEAHTATAANTANGGGAQQQRHELVRDLAADPARHLLLLTATPHSGIEESFQSLIGLLHPRFASFAPNQMSEAQRDQLARHFVQRRRGDVQRWLGEETPFPTRQSTEITFSLPRGSEYRKLFDDVYEFTRTLVQSSREPGSPAWRQRARYWAALALLRCVMSSPAAAEQALKIRADGSADQPDSDGDAASADALFSPYVADPAEQEAVLDQEPTHMVEQSSSLSERAQLLRFAARARALRGGGDLKLERLAALLTDLLRDGFHPIVFCRYIATANYLAEELERRLRRATDGLRVLAVTGERSEEEREALIGELAEAPRRLLIATDCLSEGINLQHAFDAVVHYDLPWNPNRLEQREGRVDRYGQRAGFVRTALIYGQDNPMDEAVMRVLLRKAVRIHRTLGISVPLPVDNSTVVDTLIDSLFVPTTRQATFLEDLDQMSLAEADQRVQQLEVAWDLAVEREKESRTRFAQRRIHPDEVARELEESDAALGDTATVERFVLAACDRLAITLAQPSKGRRRSDDQQANHAVYELAAEQLPPARPELRTRIFGTQSGKIPPLRFCFGSPAPEGVETVGRHHRLTSALAEYLLEAALEASDQHPPAARCGLIRTSAVERRTLLLLLRVRLLIETARQPIVAEELVVAGLSRVAGAIQWLAEPEALRLLEQALPQANVAPEERRTGVQAALALVQEQHGQLREIAAARAERLREAHQRVRSVTGGGRVQVRPTDTPDLLGVYVLLPVVG
ncbi:MAG: helicase-related protein [Roseiflexaceae bacterium]